MCKRKGTGLYSQPSSQECAVERHDSFSNSVEMKSILAFLVGSLAGLAAATSCTSDVAKSWYDFNHPKGGGGGDRKCTPEDIQNGNTVSCASNWIEKRDGLRARSALECSAIEMCFAVSDGSLLCFNPVTGE
jgi:hypothetical protein